MHVSDSRSVINPGTWLNFQSSAISIFRLSNFWINQLTLGLMFQMTCNTFLQRLLASHADRQKYNLSKEKICLTWAISSQVYVFAYIISWVMWIIMQKTPDPCNITYQNVNFLHYPLVQKQLSRPFHPLWLSGDIWWHRDIDLGQHWLRQWLAVCQHQTITWFNVELLCVLRHPPESDFTRCPQDSLCTIYLKITLLELWSYLQGANKLRVLWMECTMF